MLEQEESVKGRSSREKCPCPDHPPPLLVQPAGR